MTKAAWNRYEIGMDKSCVYTGPGRSAPNWFSYLVPKGFTCESDQVRNFTVNFTVPGWCCDRVNPTQFRLTRARVDPIQMKPNCADLVQLSPE